MATSLPTHRANRAAAGAAYANAAAAYVSAWVELQAYDSTVGNANIGGGRQPPFGDVPHLALHAEFLPSSTAGSAIGDLAGRVRTRHEQLNAS